MKSFRLGIFLPNNDKRIFYVFDRAHVDVIFKIKSGVEINLNLTTLNFILSRPSEKFEEEKRAVSK
jgi:hypothetical protein